MSDAWEDWILQEFAHDLVRKTFFFFFLNSEPQLSVHENSMITKYVSNDRKTGT